MEGIFHGISEDDYHADCCDQTSLSSSIAKILWDQTPKQAWLAHPKLNPNYKQVDSKLFDLGTAAHKLLLEGSEKGFVIVDAKDWRTKTAQEERDIAYANKLTPLLPHNLDAVRAMANEARWFLVNSELGRILDNGFPEVTVICQHEGMWLRSRLDWLVNDRTIIMDYKTTTCAKPDAFLRRVMDNGHDIQAAFYKLANGLTGGPTDALYVWLVQEVDPPYLCSLVAPSTAMLEVAEGKLKHAFKLWKKCLAENKWPGYGNRITYVDPKPWDIAAVEQAMYEGV